MSFVLASLSNFSVLKLLVLHGFSVRMSASGAHATSAGHICFRHGSSVFDDQDMTVPGGEFPQQSATKVRGSSSLKKVLPAGNNIFPSPGGIKPKGGGTLDTYFQYQRKNR